MAGYDLGQPVATAYAGERRVGEVVAVQQAFGHTLYDVSLEDVVVKAVPAGDVEAVAAAELQALVQLGVQMPPALSSVRENVLRERHMRFLAGALAQMTAGEAEEVPSQRMRFELGERVATRSAGAWQLGTVRGFARTNEGVRYELEVMDEVVQASEDDVAALADVRGDGAFGLGDRVRLLAAGHEADDEFVGVVCMVEALDEGAAYGIAFDDGDVFVGLTDKDLAPVRA